MEDAIVTCWSVFPTNLSPFHHVMIAGGRDPKVLHSSQYDLSADNGSRLLIIDTSFGRTKKERNFWRTIEKLEVRKYQITYIFHFYSPKYSHFISMVTEVFTGIVILLFEALHVSSARRSSLLILGMDNVFWTVCL